MSFKINPNQSESEVWIANDGQTEIRKQYGGVYWTLNEIKNKANNYCYANIQDVGGDQDAVDEAISCPLSIALEWKCWNANAKAWENTDIQPTCYTINSSTSVETTVAPSTTTMTTTTLTTSNPTTTTTVEVEGGCCRKIISQNQPGKDGATRENFIFEIKNQTHWIADNGMELHRAYDKYWVISDGGRVSDLYCYVDEDKSVCPNESEKVWNCHDDGWTPANEFKLRCGDDTTPTTTTTTDTTTTTTSTVTTTNVTTTTTTEKTEATKTTPTTTSTTTSTTSTSTTTTSTTTTTTSTSTTAGECCINLVVTNQPRSDGSTWTDYKMKLDKEN